jgi:hypothetical protein
MDERRESHRAMTDAGKLPNESEAEPTEGETGPEVMTVRFARRARPARSESAANGRGRRRGSLLVPALCRDALDQ